MSELTAARSAKTFSEAISERAKTLGAFETRIATVLVALLILYIRMPENFTNPQFWAEDGAIFFKFTSEIGIRGLLIQTAGYYITLPWLVAVVAKLFSPIWAPWIYNYTAVGLDLLVVYLATSPRFNMPLRPLLAVAVVTVPAGYETLGALANSMWVLPIGAFILLFSSPSSKLVLTGEAIFLAIQGATGPFSLFLLPLYAIRLVAVRQDRQAYHRMVLLTIIVAAGALLQAGSLYVSRNTEAFGPSFASAYSSQLWFTLPFIQIFRSFGPWDGTFFFGNLGLVAALVTLALVVALAFQRPYRPQKLMMAFLGFVIAFSGMVKYRYALTLVLHSGDRYFYIESVYFLWFIGCAYYHGIARHAGAAVVLIAEIISIVMAADTPRQRADLEWPVWASYFSAGIPVNTIPIAPDWEMNMPATSGPLAAYVTWQGKTLAELGLQVDPSVCSGAFEIFEPDLYHDPLNPNANGTRAIAKGWAWDSSEGRPVRLIALADGKDRVIGLGLPGFKNGGDTVRSFPQSGWIGTLANDPTTVVHAYAILDEGLAVCPLDNTRSVSHIIADFTLGAFTDAVALTPGTKIVQRVDAPSNNLSSISLRTVSWGKIPSSYFIEWQVVSVAGDTRRVLASGQISTKGRIDWQLSRLAIPPMGDSDEVDVEFFVPSNQDASTPLGLPLNRLPSGNRAAPVEVNGKPHADNLVLALIVREGG